MTWPTVKLGEVCSIEKGNIGIMKAIPGEYPLVVLGEDRRTHNEYQFDDEAVVIPLVSSTGHGHRSMKRIFFQSGKFSIGSILCAVVPKDKSVLSAEFLYRYLDFNKENELVGRMRGMANVTLPMKEIALVEIPLPPLDEQRKLVQEFQKLETNNNEITNELSPQLDLVSQLRQAFLREAMQGKLVPQDERDEPAEILLQKIKTEKAKLIADGKLREGKIAAKVKPHEKPFEIPISWVWCRLGDIVQSTQGVQIPKDQQTSSLRAGFRRYLYISDFEANHELKYVEDKYPTKVVTKNDLIVVNTGATSGKIYRGIDGILSNNLFKVSFDQHRLNPDFIYSFVTSAVFRDFQRRLVKGAANPHMGHKNFNATVFPLPPLAEQERIVAKLEKLMAYCDELEANIRTSKHHAETLLQVALKEALEPR